MLKEKIFNPYKKLPVIILSVIIISIITGMALYREHTMRCAVVSAEGLTFDGMLFEPCTDYKFTSTLEKTKIICKTTDANWVIWSVDGYEESLEYVFANCFMDGYWYKKVN